MLFRAKVIATLFPGFHSHSKLKNILKTFGEANPSRNITSFTPEQGSLTDGEGSVR